MKHKLSVLLLVLACLLVFTGCQCEHEWVEANCTTAKTCSLCGEVEGTPLGHTWAAATCETAKTCETCGETEGEALGHSWEEATCVTPKTCRNCNLTEGEALGHTWMEATTEAPKTCETCGLTEGERIMTDDRFTTAAASNLFGSWELEIALPGDTMDMGELVDEVPVIITFHFGNAGDLMMNMRFADLDAFLDNLITVTTEQTYLEMEADGMSREEVDASIEAETGMTTEEYVASLYTAIDWNAMMDVYNLEFVYYVEGDQLYLDYTWTGTFADPATIVVSDNTLTMTDSSGTHELKRING